MYVYTQYTFTWVILKQTLSSLSPNIFRRVVKQPGAIFLLGTPYLEWLSNWERKWLIKVEDNRRVSLPGGEDPSTEEVRKPLPTSPIILKLAIQITPETNGGAKQLAETL